MKKNKFLLYVVTVFITFITVLSFSNPVNAKELSEYTREEMRALQTDNAFEMTICEMCLAVGDFVMEYLTFLLKEEITVQKIIYNRVDALNANFFANASNPSPAPASKFITKAVNTWYDLLRKNCNYCLCNGSNCYWNYDYFRTVLDKKLKHKIYF